MLSTLFSNDVRQTLDQFRRSFDQMFDNGILNIQVPIMEASKTKQIQIQTGEERKAIRA